MSAINNNGTLGTGNGNGTQKKFADVWKQRISALIAKRKPVTLENFLFEISLWKSDLSNESDLYLEGLGISDENVDLLKDTLKQFVGLKSVTLNDNNLRSNGLRLFLDMIDPKTLEYLDVGKNQIGVEGCRHLEEFS